MSRYWPWVAQESEQPEKHCSWWPPAAFSQGASDLDTSERNRTCYRRSGSGTSSPSSEIHNERRRAELTE
jgi:hypothetical protein